MLNSTSQSSGRDGDTPNHCLVEIADSFMSDSDTTKRGLLAHLTVVSGATAAVPTVPSVLAGVFARRTDRFIVMFLHQVLNAPAAAAAGAAIDENCPETLDWRLLVG